MAALVVSVAYLDEDSDLIHEMWEIASQKALDGWIASVNQTGVTLDLKFNELGSGMMGVIPKLESLFIDEEGTSVKCYFFS